MRVIGKDAADYQFPPGPLVIYFYNPFGESLFRQVIANLAQSLAADHRPCSLIYVTGMETMSWASSVLDDDFAIGARGGSEQ